MPRPSVSLAITAVALSLALVSCAPEPMPVPTPSPTHTSAPSGDGVLRIGTLFPTTGASAFIAKAQDAGVELAVREINEAGGVNGKPVEVFHRDSGDASTEKAEQSLADLLEKKVDVVIGPSSSVLAERLLPKIVDARVVMISPSATDPGLSLLADNGYFFRTIPSAALQGAALAEIAGKGKKVAIIYYSDTGGRAVRDSLAKSLADVDGELVASEGFSTTTNDADKILSVLKKAEPEVVVLVSPFSAMAKNKSIISALVAGGFGGSKLWLTSQNLADYSQALPAGTLKGANGILEGVAPEEAFTKRVKSADPSVTDFRYAAESYDATILAALAAIVAGDDSGEAISIALRGVSRGGIKCLSFGECLDVLKTREDIDYDGISGPIGLDEAGDPHPAHYGLYVYDGENKFKRVGDVTAG